MFSYYLPEIVGYTIYDYMTCENLLYCNVPNFVWTHRSKRYSRSLGNAKDTVIYHEIIKGTSSDKLPKYLLCDEYFILLSIRLCYAPNILKIISEEYKTKEVALAAVKGSPYAFQYVPETLKGDYDVIFAALDTYGTILEYVPKSFIETHIRDLLKITPYAMSYINQTKQLVLEAIKINGNVFPELDEEFMNDIEILRQACESGKIILREVRICHDYNIKRCPIFHRLFQQGYTAALDYIQQQEYKLIYDHYESYEYLHSADISYHDDPTNDDLTDDDLTDDISEMEDLGGDILQNEHSDHSDDLSDTEGNILCELRIEVEDGYMFFLLE